MLMDHTLLCAGPTSVFVPLKPSMRGGGRVHGNSAGTVVPGSSQLAHPQEIAVGIVLGNEDVVVAGAQHLLWRGRREVETSQPLKRPSRIDVPGGVHRDANAIVIPESAHAAYPEQGTGRGKLCYERVRTADGTDAMAKSEGDGVR